MNTTKTQVMCEMTFDLYRDSNRLVMRVKKENDVDIMPY